MGNGQLTTQPKSRNSHLGFLTKTCIVITLLFMKALRHWTTLCWFFLSIFSCLGAQESNEEDLVSNVQHEDSKLYTYCLEMSPH